MLQESRSDNFKGSGIKSPRSCNLAISSEFIYLQNVYKGINDDIAGPSVVSNSVVEPEVTRWIGLRIIDQPPWVFKSAGTQSLPLSRPPFLR